MSRHIPHRQRTIRQSAELCGFGLFGGRDVTVRFEPAADNFGIVFSRSDLPGSPRIPAHIDFAETDKPETARRTVLRNGRAVVQMTEHTLAALAGLRIDNCLISLDADELPGLDGSAIEVTQALLAAGIEQQTAERRLFPLREPAHLVGYGGEIIARPAFGDTDSLRLSYELDYGTESVIPPHEFEITVTPETFQSQLAAARTFVLESEVAALQAAGIGLRVTHENVLVLGREGPIGNALRFPDEPARHKALDCVGDFALLGCDLVGEVDASRSGHALNRRFVKHLLEHGVLRQAA